MDKSIETIRQQAAEIERLRFALHGCLAASKRIDPIEYAPSLEFIQEQAHESLYGDLVNFEKVERVKITHKWKESSV